MTPMKRAYVGTVLVGLFLSTLGGCGTVNCTGPANADFTSVDVTGLPLEKITAFVLCVDQACETTPPNDGIESDGSLFIYKTELGANPAPRTISFTVQLNDGTSQEFEGSYTPEPYGEQRGDCPMEPSYRVVLSVSDDKMVQQF